MPKDYPSEALVAAWVQERLALAEQEWEDVWFLEQVPNFPWVEKVETPLEGKFGMASIVTGPSSSASYHGVGWAPSRHDD